MLGFVIIAPLCLQNLSTVQLISWNLNEFPQFSIRRQVENNWLPWQHLRTKENFKTCKIILNGVKKLVKFLYSILSRLGVIEKSSPFRRILPPPPPRLDRVKTEAMQVVLWPINVYTFFDSPGSTLLIILAVLVLQCHKCVTRFSK